jgi:hypothetical protein
MSKGSCLCGSVTWETHAEPYAMYNCHCRMCQKAHGAAFGTYCFFREGEVRWTGGTDKIAHYRSSEILVRSSCDVCGSVVPYCNEAGDHWVTPAGCHETMRKPDYNIFVVDNSPWHTINGDLPRCDAYPEESGIPSVKGVPVPGKAEGNVRGSCLCGAVTYEVTEPFKVAHNCHCSRCRRARASAHASNAFVSYDGVVFLSGEDRLRAYKLPDARFFTQVFCEVCSSPMPRRDAERGITTVPMGSLDDDPEICPVDHIFVAYKADWHEITDDLPQFQEGPPPA